MTNESYFEAWAPDDVHWTQWAKPVLFAHLDRVAPGAKLPDDWATIEKDMSWVPRARGNAALVVDLPGNESVHAGLALARLGYRPVPLYNASVGAKAVLDLEPVARSLAAGAEVMRQTQLPPDAPPAFLLDARRMKPEVLPGPGRFDNRWLILPQDFPSANYLRARGIGEVILVQREEEAPQEDLAHVLLRWRQAGMELYVAAVRGTGRPRELHVRPPSFFRRAWYRAIALMGLRRSNVGGFGAVIPEPSSGGYG